MVVSSHAKLAQLTLAGKQAAGRLDCTYLRRIASYPATTMQVSRVHYLPACQRDCAWALLLMAHHCWSYAHSPHCQLAAGWPYCSAACCTAAAGVAHSQPGSEGCRLRQCPLAPGPLQAAGRLHTAGTPRAADCSGAGGSSGHRPRPGRRQPPGWPLPPALTAAPERRRSEG